MGQQACSGQQDDLKKFLHQVVILLLSEMKKETEEEGGKEEEKGKTGKEKEDGGVLVAEAVGRQDWKNLTCVKIWHHTLSPIRAVVKERLLVLHVLNPILKASLRERNRKQGRKVHECQHTSYHA